MAGREVIVWQLKDDREQSQDLAGQVEGLLSLDVNGEN